MGKIKTMTVNDLYKSLAREIQKGNGSKKILISDDDELNGMHELFSGIGYADEELIECGINMPFGVTKKNIREYVFIY